MEKEPNKSRRELLRTKKGGVNVAHALYVRPAEGFVEDRQHTQKLYLVQVTTLTAPTHCW